MSRWLSVVLVVLVLVVSLASADSRLPYTVSKHRLGPFAVHNEQVMYTILSAPIDDDAKGIVFWGNWVLYDARDNKVIPQGQVFLHHVMLFGLVMGQNILVAGSSDERTTFGPNLRGNFVMPTDGTQVKGNVLLNGFLPEKRNIWIEYELHYYTAAQMPNNPIKVLATLSAINLEVPQLGAGRIYNQSADWYMPVDGYLVTAVAHLHVGGITGRLIDASNGDVVCDSPVIYHTLAELPCKIECPGTCAVGRGGLGAYPAIKSIRPCDIYRWYPSGTMFKMDIQYDASCSFSSNHGHLYMWYAPAPRPL